MRKLAEITRKGGVVMRRNAGFTIVELLVVVAIISVLAAMLFPVFIGVKKSVLSTKCQSNLKQLGTALQMYMSDYQCIKFDYGGYIPWGTGRSWSEKLFAYHKTIELYQCPARKKNFTISMNSRLGTSEARNPVKPSIFIAMFEAPGCGKGKLPPDPSLTQNQKEQTGDADLTNEGQTGFGDCYGVKRVGNSTVVITEYDPKGNIEAQAMENWPADSWKRFHYLYFPGPHNGKVNILFFDGRVASFSDWTPGRMTFNPASTY